MNEMNEEKKRIKTHHCRFCNHLLLATTRDLSTLPRRREPGRDGALVLPLPVSDIPDDDEDDDDDDEDEDEDDEDEDDEKDEGEGTNSAQGTPAPAPAPAPAPKPKPAQSSTSKADTDTDTSPGQPGAKKEYSILLSTTLPDRGAILVRRDDGFEKRTMLRCGRCRVVVGYFLDKTHFGAGAGGAGGAGTGSGAGSVVYILPGALVDTGSMGDEKVMKMVDREWSSW